MSTSENVVSAEEITKADILKQIEDLDKQIALARAEPATDPDPGHDLYRAVMWLECMSCGNRYVDQGECAICRPNKAFLAAHREKYPWKSDQKGPPVELVTANARGNS